MKKRIGGCVGIERVQGQKTEESLGGIGMFLFFIGKVWEIKA